jgi:chaperonin GroES
MTDQVFSSDGSDDGLRDRLIITQFGHYLAQYVGENQSGLQPLCDKVLVLCDQAADMTAGGIHIPDDAREKIGFASTTGVLVAVGPQAFAYDSRRLVYWEGARPKAGDRVVFQKYSGIEYHGRDRLMYRLMEDRCIGALELPELEAVEAVGAVEAGGTY